METEITSVTPTIDLLSRRGADDAASRKSDGIRESKLAGGRVVPIVKRDSRLDDEARTAAQIVQGMRGNAQERTAAETQMVERYSTGLGFLLSRRLGDSERARDLLQETFCIAIRKLREIELDNPERLAGYLRGIAIRVAMNATRRRSREPFSIDTTEVMAVPDTGPRQFENLARNETAAAVRELLDNMPVARDRELLMRLYVYDQGKEEICQALGLSSLHFNRVLFRAKGRFRKLLENRLDAQEISAPLDE